MPKTYTIRSGKAMFSGVAASGFVHFDEMRTDQCFFPVKFSSSNASAAPFAGL